MRTSRLEAFSDGVIAIIITIMVLELKEPAGTNLASLGPVLPVLSSYVLSFVYVGIYWNNHHHMIHATREINGGIMWANLHLLFWLSLVPFVTRWMGQNYSQALPTALYGVVLLMAAVAYFILQLAIIHLQGSDSLLAKAVGRDLKGKLSMVCYAAAIGLAFVSHWLADALYLFVATIWLIPDRRIVRALEKKAPSK
jgi:uncharacterized membrane protein